MTHILLIVNAPYLATMWQLDPRPPRELIKEINTGHLRIGGEVFDTITEQSACAIPENDTVVVTFCPPAYRLTPRLYQTLWGLADGKTAEEIAAELNITARTVYLHTARLKERFDVQTIEELLRLADEHGLI